MVKNINMLMAVPVALLAKATAQDRYRRRAEQLIAAEMEELDRTVAGKPAPNLGYYSVDTVRMKGEQGHYVAVAQTPGLAKAISCNNRTLSGQSCTDHLGIEARGLAMAEQKLGRPSQSYSKYVLQIMGAYEARDAAMCSGEHTSLGTTRSYTACVAYYCALRKVSPRFNDRCFSRVSAWGVNSQDAVLGLFWGDR
jgi:hypothetical protein